MQIVSGIVEMKADGKTEAEVKKAIRLIDDFPPGKIAAARLYEEILRAVCERVAILDFDEPFEVDEAGGTDPGGTEPPDWDIKKPGRYDSCFEHDPIIYDTYALFARLRRSLLEADPENAAILSCLYIRLKTLRLEIRNRIIGEPEKIGDLYKELLQSGAKHIKLHKLDELLNK